MVVLAQPDQNLVLDHHSPAIRHGTLTSVRVLINQIGDYINNSNADPEPFAWTAAAAEILAKVQLVQIAIKKLHHCAEHLDRRQTDSKSANER